METKQFIYEQTTRWGEFCAPCEEWVITQARKALGTDTLPATLSMSEFEKISIHLQQFVDNSCKKVFQLLILAKFVEPNFADNVNRYVLRLFGADTGLVLRAVSGGRTAILFDLTWDEFIILAEVGARKWQDLGQQAREGWFRQSPIGANFFTAGPVILEDVTPFGTLESKQLKEAWEKLQVRREVKGPDITTQEHLDTFQSFFEGMLKRRRAAQETLPDYFDKRLDGEPAKSGTVDYSEKLDKLSPTEFKRLYYGTWDAFEIDAVSRDELKPINFFPSKDLSEQPGQLEEKDTKAEDGDDE